MPENYHNENRMIIGEAAVHLAINNADITVDPLIRELADMVAAEEDPACCVLRAACRVRGAKRWRSGFKSLPGNRDELRWVTGGGRGSTH